MQRCGCGRDQRFGEAWCPACGRRFGLGVAGLGPGAVPPPRRAGTVVAAQVVLGLGAAGNGLLALVGTVGLVTLASYDLSGGLVLGGLVILLYCLAGLGFDVWALLAIGKGNRTARLLATVVPAAAIVVDIVVFAVLASSAGQAVITILLAVPHAAALAILLWVPETSRRYFGDAVPAAPRPVPSGPIPAPRLSFTPHPAPIPARGAGFSFGQSSPLPAPSPAADGRDAVTVTLPATGPATPSGGRHRVADVPAAR